MSTCTRWWHCLCRLTPSLATSPVMSTRTGASARSNASTTAAARRRAARRAAPRTRVLGRPQPPAGSSRRSQFSVATRSRTAPPASATARADADLPQVGDAARPAWPSRLRARCGGELRRAGSAPRPRESCSSPCLRQRPRTGLDGLDQRGGRGEERLGQDPREELASRPGDRRRALRRVQPGAATARRRRRPRPEFAATARTLRAPAARPTCARPRGPPRASAGGGG